MLGVADNERSMSGGGAKHDRVTRGSANHTATKVAFNGFYVPPWLCEFYAQGRHARTCAVTRCREHPCEAAFDKHRRLNVVSEEPAELDVPLFVVFFLQDLFRAGELFVASHLVYG